MSARVALLGVGTVGSALLDRFDRLADDIAVVHVASSRQRVTDPDGIDVRTAVEKLRASELANDLGAVSSALGEPDSARVVVDATASPAVAARHAHWLLRGIHVVTASKIASGGGQTDADALAVAARVGGARYGASATVGAGLPVLRAIDALRAGGDKIIRIAGVLSGSLAWILDTYETGGCRRSLADLVDEARRLGLTEPDPSVDLSGEDVRRKLLVLARAAGARLEPADIDVTPLTEDPMITYRRRVVPSRGLYGAERHQQPAIRDHWADQRLRYVGTWAPGERPTVGLVALPASNPLAAGSGCDNRVAIWSSRYDDQPLVVQGPGAGAGVTAAALLDDIRLAVPAVSAPLT